MTEREIELERRCGDARINMETTIAMAVMLDNKNKPIRGIVKINKNWLKIHAPSSHYIKEAERFLDGT